MYQVQPSSYEHVPPEQVPLAVLMDALVSALAELSLNSALGRRSRLVSMHGSMKSVHC